MVGCQDSSVAPEVRQSKEIQESVLDEALASEISLSPEWKRLSSFQHQGFQAIISAMKRGVTPEQVIKAFEADVKTRDGQAISKNTFSEVNRLFFPDDPDSANSYDAQYQQAQSEFWDQYGNLLEQSDQARKGGETCKVDIDQVKNVLERLEIIATSNDGNLSVSMQRVGGGGDCCFEGCKKTQLFICAGMCGLTLPTVILASVCGVACYCAACSDDTDDEELNQFRRKLCWY